MLDAEERLAICAVCSVGLGWTNDTLTEDLGLTYRAQLAGWRGVFCPDVVVPTWQDRRSGSCWPAPDWCPLDHPYW
jgi:cellulose synthase/poly-beta-1,6-N-acetylglucosamine synthase-like glycosyltransferase